MLAVACFGLLPAGMSTGIGSDSQKPFSIVIVAGLVSRLLLSIFLSPVLYALAAVHMTDQRRAGEQYRTHGKSVHVTAKSTLPFRLEQPVTTREATGYPWSSIKWPVRPYDVMRSTTSAIGCPR